MALALDVYAALARKVITQHGYLSGLTMAQIVDIDDNFFPSKSSSFQCRMYVVHTALCTSSLLQTASLALFPGASNILQLQNTVQKQMLDK